MSCRLGSIFDRLAQPGTTGGDRHDVRDLAALSYLSPRLTWLSSEQSMTTHCASPTTQSS
jgi:hypothetical protein